MPKKTQIGKIAILAGSGLLPLHLYKSCKAKGIECHIIGLKDQVSLDLFNKNVPIDIIAMHSVSEIIKKIRSLGISKVLLAGKVKRTGISKLLLDIKGSRLFAKIIKHGMSDNNILTAIIAFLEDEGLEVISANAILTDIMASKGNISEAKPNTEDMNDIKHGIKILKKISECDVGQALVIQGGLILGVEAAEGTDELVKRCGAIKQKEGKKPILIKALKTGQDIRADLPCIGPDTIENLYNNGFSGITIESGFTCILNFDETLKRAKKYNVFIYGF